MLIKNGNKNSGMLICDCCKSVISYNISPESREELYKDIDLCTDCQNNTEVNNFNLIADYLSFEDPEDFYFLQIIQRKKDNNQIKDHRILKTYYIYNIGQLLDRKDSIIKLCKDNNARAYINLNVRNSKEIALECAKEYIELVASNTSQQGYRVYDKMCGKHHARNYPASWLVDLDTRDLNLLHKYVDIINSCRSKTPNYNFKLAIPTYHGFHLITNKFDIKQFCNLLKENNLELLDIHKDNPTLLYYYPNDLFSK